MSDRVPINRGAGFLKEELRGNQKCCNCNGCGDFEISINFRFGLDYPPESKKHEWNSPIIYLCEKCYNNSMAKRRGER